MRNTTAIVLSLASAAVLAPTSSAEAACDTTGSDEAYGDFWIERNTSGDCLFYQRKYSCVASGGYRTEGSPSLVTTLSGSTGTACEDTDGYDAAVALATANWKAGAGYNCDTVFTDNDQDGFGACIDHDDWNPRVFVKVNASERFCDGADNDGDGSVDDGITGCSEDRDHKRVGIGANYQGDGRAAVNVVDGNLLLTQTDAVVQGPYGALTFTRTYDSRRNTADAALGIGWTHNLAVYLSQMPSGDGRWRVQIGPEMQYFRCTSLDTNVSCVIDDHRHRGNLRRISSVWYFYDGSGNRYRFSADADPSSRYPFDRLENGAGQILLNVASFSSGRPQRIETANSSIFFYLVYGTYGLDLIRINSDSTKQILDFTVNSSSLLTAVMFASAVGTIDDDTNYTLVYDGDQNLERIDQKLDGSTTLTTARFDYDGSDRVTLIEDSAKDFAITYSTATRTNVSFEVAASGNPSTDFNHNGLWVTATNSDIRVGGLPGAGAVRDIHGRITCWETDDSRMFKRVFDDGALTKLNEYGKSGTCSSGGSILHETWFAWLYNTDRQSWRQDWMRTKSAYSPASDCSGGSLPSGCRETNYDYVSSTDDRVQWVTRTGSTKNVADSVAQQIRKQRMFYFGLDTGTCASSGDWYTGLPCRVETQDNSGTVFARTDYRYNPSGATAGLLKSVARHDKTSDGAPLTTTFASHNDFGSPAQVTDERGLVTDYVFNGWNAVTSITENDAMKDDSGTLLDPVTQYAYTKLRTLSSITLPKGNKVIYKHLTGANDYARVKAYSLADASSNLTEILRYEYDKFGRRTEQKIIDSLSGTTPCADEDCATLDGREQREYDAIGRIKTVYLHAADTSDPADDSMSYSYSGGKLDTITDYLGIATVYEYDDQGRVSKINRDATGGDAIDAETSFTYDGEGRLLTTTSPTGIETRSERNDFGEVVLERSTTRGDIHEEFDVAGRVTKRRESPYNSQTGPEDQCWTYDWLGRKKEYDRDCNGVNTNFYYDGDSTPGSACETNTTQVGRLSMHSASDFTRVLCYHKNGRLHSMYQVMGTSTWSNSTARGISRIYDLNGNLQFEYLEDRPDNTDHARKVEYVYDSTHKDRLQYIRHKLTSAGSWTLVTSDSVNPTYFAMGGFKTIKYANNVVETNEHDKARRLTRRKSETTSPAVTYSDINLTYDVSGRITQYNDSTGKRHLRYYAAYDDLSRLRCVARTSIGSCTGSQPWSQEDFLESFDFDESGNRTSRRYGAYAADDEDYTYVSGTDVIDKVNVAGTDKEMSKSFEGEITEVNTPVNIVYGWNDQGRLGTINNNFLGNTILKYSEFHDLFERTAVCNSRKTYYFYEPTGAGGASHQLRVQDQYNSCAAQWPRLLRSFIYLEGRPVAVVHSERSSSSDDQTDTATYWIHSDQLGTPIMVTDSSGIERWRWENDPFGREVPVEYTVTESDVNPDDDPANGGADNTKHNTCCCAPSCGAGCNLCETSCSAGACTGGASQDVIWSKTYTVGGANNIRLHFSTFDLAEGGTRTGKDYVRLKKADNTLLAELTGNLGAHWTRWAGDGESSMKVELVSDNTQDNKRGFVVDKLEYTTSTNGRFVLDLRMPGQVWDAEAYASSNFRRWYRSEEGRYLTPDPIGLAGGEDGYFAYSASGPMHVADPTGLENAHLRNTYWRWECDAEPHPDDDDDEQRKPALGPYTPLVCCGWVGDKLDCGCNLIPTTTGQSVCDCTKRYREENIPGHTPGIPEGTYHVPKLDENYLDRECPPICNGPDVETTLTPDPWGCPGEWISPVALSCSEPCPPPEQVFPGSNISRTLCESACIGAAELKYCKYCCPI